MTYSRRYLHAQVEKRERERVCVLSDKLYQTENKDGVRLSNQNIESRAR